MRFDPKTLDYLDLVSAARELHTDSCKRTIRIAVLADFATQHLIAILPVLFARNDVRLDVYEAAYNSIDTEILDGASGLYAYAPDYVVILVATEKLKPRLYDATDRRRAADDTVSHYRGLWQAIRQHSSAPIIQGNFVTVSERAFGNFELTHPESIGSLVHAINHGLVAASRETRSVLICDLDHLAGEVGRRSWTDEALWLMAKGLCRLDYLPLVAQALVDVTLCSAGQLIKCIVLDLDNTLWGGVIGDDGLSGIALGDYEDGEAFVGFQRFLKELKHRGMILAVVSKNEDDAARLPFREHPDMVLKETDIAVFIANWDNKAANIIRVQQTLNIGLDSMVFLDDNPVERDLVASFLPDLVVPSLPDDPSLYVRTLAQYNLFETAAFAASDAARPQQYREEADRELSRAAFGDIGDYLRSLEMTVRLERFRPFALPRIAQLIQRSNQFNLTTRRYSEAACEAMMREEAGCIPLTVTMADRFGDYGLISVVILRRPSASELEIDSYLMSCRVLKRGVEQFVMNRIVAFAAAQGIERIVGRFCPSAKNRMVRDFYADFGFRLADQAENGATVWHLDPARFEARPAFLEPLAVEL